ncbi:hypothetical protein CMK11_16950 [Candidatus Poribacteria bacterium]|nr:hypothetical protein [Candidatus Poribacteria bacterium]
MLLRGIAPFDRLTARLLAAVKRQFRWTPPFADRVNYFRGVATRLREEGFTVHHPEVSFAKTVERRAEDLGKALKKVLAEPNVDKVHIISHSMGALDARHMIVDGGMADHVASLTTIAAPHRGTHIADMLAEGTVGNITKPLRRMLELGGLSSLTTSECTAFNARAEHAEATNGVVYRAYYSFQDYPRVFAVLQPSWKIIHNKAAEGEKDNDGLAPVTSQRWQPTLSSSDGSHVKDVGQKPFPVRGDHLNVLGWWEPNDARVWWWRRSLVAQKRQYEAEVREAYVTIATEAVNS